jgi:cysteine desulfurase
VNSDGIVDSAALARLIDDDTVLVSVMYANNEVGTIQPIREIAALVRDIRERRRKAGNVTPLYLHTDATQAANYLDIHVSRLGVDMLTLNSGKMYGPKQCGALYVRAGIALRPLVFGGGQERGIRSGTENVSGIVGFAEALDITQNMRRDESHRLTQLQKLCIERLAQKIPLAVINGSLKQRLPNNIHVTIPGQDNERMLMALDEVGIMAAAGSACSASDEEPSHVLRAMGISDADAQASLRFTLGRATTEQDIRLTVDELARIVA